jgi:hypothetical protein
MSRTYSERKGTKTDLALAQMPPERLTPMSGEWWAEQAAQFTGPCPRCKATWTESEYTISRTSFGECGIVQSCRMCGWETLQMKGRWGVPYGLGVTVKWENIDAQP